MRPNILLVVFDTARADALEPYGAPAGSSPVVADLARRGGAVTNVFATANWTLPSHASMLTGLLPRDLALETDASPRAGMHRHTARILPEVLRRTGYATAAASSNVWISPAYGFDVGFERFSAVRGTRRHAPEGGVRGRVRWSYEAIRARLDDGLAALDDVLGRWIDASPAAPFFWFVNLMECHSPYLPPSPWNDLGPIERHRAGRDARLYQSHAGFLRVCLGELEVPASSFARMRHLYARAVASMDDWLGRLLGRLDARGALDDTLVIVTSDHGENLGENHLLGHGMSVDDRLLRVPLIAAGPGATALKAGLSGGARSLVDVPRAIAHALEIADHPWRDRAVADGLAVAQSDGMSVVGRAAAARIVQAWNLSPRARAELEASREAITDSRFKLVRVDGGERLHDLASDPLEAVDVRSRFPQEAARLARELDAHQAASVVPAASASAPSDEGGDLEERLRLLGYL